VEGANPYFNGSIVKPNEAVRRMRNEEREMHSLINQKYQSKLLSLRENSSENVSE
jgi:hypothetical protein